MVSEVEKNIIECIENRESFVLEAGAGSGKTWTLIKSILYVLEKNELAYKKENRKIACITFTRVARDEILERITANADDYLIVIDTIHEFLWRNICNYNKEIKDELINYINEKKLEKKKITDTSTKGTKKHKEAQVMIEKYEDRLEKLKIFSGKIKYQNIPNWGKGVISHDELLYIAHNIFKKYKVARKVIEDSYPIIFIDEYQDTNPLVKDILLEYLLRNTSIILGFFGDSMQQIYDKSMGKIDLEKHQLKSITKKENYRSSIEVINLLNNIRDDIKQIPSGIEKHGKCLFYYINNLDEDVENFIEMKVYKDLGINKNDFVKKLYLTTASIAKKNDYSALHDLFNKEQERNKDELLKNKDNRSSEFANYLYDIEEIIEMYEAKKIQQLLKKIDFKLNGHQDKQILNKYLKELKDNRTKWNIGEVFKFVNSKKILPMGSEISLYYSEDEIFSKDKFFLDLISLRYLEFKNLYYTVKRNSPFTTEHGTKGDEYDNVICIVNDNDWRNYNISNYLDKSDIEERESRYLRTKKLFYVVCSRAKYNLAIVNLSRLTDNAIETVKQIFGDENFINVYEKN